MINKLKTEITTFLDKTGFNSFETEIDKMKKLTKGMGNTFKDMFNFKKAFGGIASNPLVQLAGGYFTLTGAVGQYNKMVDASNKQIALEIQMDSALKAQGYINSQIQGLKDYAGELQNAGIIGDEASIVAIKQMASFKLKEDSIRSLLPQVHNLMVAEKGLNSTEADAEKWSKAFGIALSTGQVRGLKQAGIVLDEHTQKVFENANEQQRAAILVKELKERIGEQNAEILKTPEGKIVNAQNRIGDVYERFGGILRETRGKFWSFMADNLDMIAPFTEKLIKGLAGGFDTGINTVKFLFHTFSNMPTGAKTAIGLLTGFFALTKFPILGGLLIIEDIFGAFQGKDSLIGKVFDKMTEFFGFDYKFSDLMQGIWAFWAIFTKGADSGIEKISLTTKILLDFLDTLKGGAGIIQMAWGATGGFLIDTVRILVGDFENVGKSSLGNIEGGWNRLHGAGSHMNETGKMYDNYLLEEANKEVQKKIADMEYYTKNRGRKSIPLNENLMQNLTKNSTFNSSPTYNINITGNFTNPEELTNKIKSEVKNLQEKQIRQWQVQYGSDFGF